jgi:deazaflavin-dependent oxidoreductase (nitroreductase family)
MGLDQQTIERLADTRTIDFTTVGRRSGQPVRIEIWWFRVGDRFIITGTPGPRDWLANVMADPSVIIHAPFGDYVGRASVVEDQERRREVMVHPDLSWYSTQAELDDLVNTSPMIEITLDSEHDHGAGQV